MTPLKTIIATAVIAVGGTVAAFSGLHIGQPSADAAAANQAAKAKTTYAVTLTARQLATLMHGKSNRATHQARHQRRHAQRHAVRHQSYRSSGRTYSSGSYNSGSSYGHSGYSCYGSGGSHSGDGCW